MDYIPIDYSYFPDNHIVTLCYLLNLKEISLKIMPSGYSVRNDKRYDKFKRI